MGFVARLIARIPFLVIATRLYGAEALGRFASALVLIEIVALICALGEKRGLAQRLAESAGEDRSAAANLVYDGILLALLYSALAAIILLIFPEPMFPNGMNSAWDICLVATIPALAVTEILLAAQAYRFDIATTVRARAVVEPWTISILAGVFFFIPATRASGLALAFIASVYAGLITALWPFLKSYGLPRRWQPRPAAMLALSARAFPLVGADAIERGTRLLDIFILGLIAPPQAVGIYYAAQQIASLPQKLKTSFEPILSPVITRNLRIGNREAIAAQVRQVGFWIIAVQLGIALALGIPGEAVMGLWGPDYVAGTAALAFLLAAEVVASLAVVSESVLIYIARKRNLAISLGIIALQAGLTVVLIEASGRLGLGKGYQAAAAAAALMLALGASSLIKALLLRHLLGASVSNWRWPLVYAAAATVVVGELFTWLPEWIELLFGIPAMLATYALLIWRRAFDESDKILFRKKIVPAADGASPAP
jgi:O-antigen/teichoic acid export membrane protein